MHKTVLYMLKWLTVTVNEQEAWLASTSQPCQRPAQLQDAQNVNQLCENKNTRICSVVSTKPVSEPMKDSVVYWCIYASLSLDELTLGDFNLILGG